MHGVETQPRMRAQHAIACGENPVVRRHLWMLVHVVLGMPAKVFAVGTHGHLFKRQPAVEWFGLMAEQYDAIVLDALNDRLKARVIRHHVASVRIAQGHADVLPDLYPNSALGDGVID